MVRIFIFLVTLISLQNLHCLEVIAVDSGNRPIKLYNNEIKSKTALLVLGGIHPDEDQTIEVINFLKDNIKTELSIYYIPILNPTLYNLDTRKRGYLREHLDEKGFVIPGSNLESFDKELYYRTFYGSEKSYINVIGHYIDPNRDFNEKLLPSTRALIQLIESLQNKHEEVVIISFHGYMSGGRVYPEYKIIKSETVVDNKTWDMCREIESSSGFIREKIYTPAIPIIDRFSGELIAYTGNIESVTGIDIELNSNNRSENLEHSLNGIKALITYLLDKQ